MTITRRSLTTAAAWTVPTVAVAVAAPQAAASVPTAPVNILIQTHFDVHADNKAGLVQVKFGYQGDKQGNGYPDLAVTEQTLVDGVVQTTRNLTLVKSGPARPYFERLPVAKTGTHTVSYVVRDASGAILLTNSMQFISPDWWKWQ